MAVFFTVEYNLGLFIFGYFKIYVVNECYWAWVQGNRHRRCDVE